MEAEQKIADKGLDQSSEDTSIDIVKENRELKAKIKQLQDERDTLNQIIKQNSLEANGIINR
jgi:uncharacterized protein YlxW (UPF0749 family)